MKEKPPASRGLVSGLYSVVEAVCTVANIQVLSFRFYSPGRSLALCVISLPSFRKHFHGAFPESVFEEHDNYVYRDV